MCLCLYKKEVRPIPGREHLLARKLEPVADPLHDCYRMPLVRETGEYAVVAPSKTTLVWKAIRCPPDSTCTDVRYYLARVK